MALSTIGTNQLGTGSDTDAIDLPSGTTAQRPSSPVEGMIRENTTQNVVEVYDGTGWTPVGQQTILYSVDYLVVAGGGSGGNTYQNSGNSAGGGGAGGYRTSVGTSGGGASAESTLNVSVGSSYTVTIGAGGAAETTPFDGGNPGSNSVFSTITAIGGGSGGSDRPCS